MHLDSIFTAAFVACLVLATGAAAKMFSKRFGLPYTVVMMLLGLGLGTVVVRHSGGHEVATIARLLASGAAIEPHLILFVFLPALVFESAFALDQRALAKQVGRVGFLAVPAMLVGTALVAAVMMLLTSGSWAWSWPAALVFGALISATDPVAVVALLRETGAPVRIATLIEGESLLNDGTAIVVFTVLIGVLLGTESFHVSSALGRFMWVVSLGAAIGLTFAGVTTWWLRKTFNEPLVEITLTVAVAYLAMLVAEGFFHVSGVIAVVAAGLWMGARGRTAVSPEVADFLHHFWEMLAHIANTLIFFFVGLVIAAQLSAAHASDLLVVIGAYVAVVIVRFIVIFASRPIFNIKSIRMTARDATLVSWGGLRGAVSLALALIVAQNEAIDLVLRQQILLATGGVVMLSILVNGTTTGRLLRKLGFDRKTPSEQLASLNAEGAALGNARKRLDELSRSKDLRTLPWSEVDTALAARVEEFRAKVRSLETALEDSELGDDERLAEMWRQALRVEREAYWHMFADGTLGAKAVATLTHEVEQHIDRLGRGELEPPHSRGQPGRKGWRRTPAVVFHRIALGYDIARAEAAAAEKVRAALDHLKDDSPAAIEVASHYRRYYRYGKERNEEMRINLPEVVHALEKRLVHRIALNVERDEITRLTKRGTLEAAAGEAALDAIKARMKKLHFGPVEAKLPSATELCRKVPLFAGLSAGSFEAVASHIKQHVLEPGEVLFEMGNRGSSVFVIVRGAVHVIGGNEADSPLLDILGAGEFFGEMAFLSGAPRTATIRAATTVTLAEIDRSALTDLIRESTEVADQLWDAYATHVFDNVLRRLPRFEHLSHVDRAGWIGGCEHVTLEPGQKLDAKDAHLALVVDGALSCAGAVYAAPALINVREQLDAPTADQRSRVVLLPPRL